jgi:vancomycin resistance protein YoaR
MKWFIAPAVALASATLVAAPMLSWPQEHVISSYATSLGGRTRAQRHNAELAMNRLSGVHIAAGATFSFNGRVGTFSRDQGYRRAPVSYDGTLLQDWGGGVCQTSTTLYNAALLSGMKIVERNRHEFAPGYIGVGRDAAVAYTSIDLKFTNPYAFPVWIEGRIEGDCLLVEFHADQALPIKPRIVADVEQVRRPDTFRLPDGNGPEKVRTGGKAGCEVTIYRITGDHRERISHDVYPVMNRVIETPGE